MCGGGGGGGGVRERVHAHTKGQGANKKNPKVQGFFFTISDI